jgi:hypothetical protein
LIFEMSAALCNRCLEVHLPKSDATRAMEEDQSRVMDVLWRGGARA